MIENLRAEGAGIEQRIAMQLRRPCFCCDRTVVQVPDPMRLCVQPLSTL